LVSGGQVLAAQDGLVTALDEHTGSARWTWQGGKSVYGMWLSGGAAIVLTDQVGTQARFSALRLTDGRVMWSDPVAANGILGNVVTTADAGLAWVRSDGAIQAMRTSDGKIRWTHAGSRSAALIDIAGRVLFGVAGTVTAYDDTTGALDWAVSGMPQEPQLAAASGRAIVSSATSGGASPTAVVALDPATGKQDWRFDNGQTETLLGSDPTGILLASGPFSYALRLIDAETGRQSWQVGTTVQSLDSEGLLAHGLAIDGEGGTVASPKTYLVARSLESGGAVWTVPLSGLLIGRQPITAAASLIIAQLPPRGALGSSVLAAYQSSNGQQAWTFDVPTLMQAPVTVDGKTLIVESADPAYGCATRG
jgi:outer membrane protein assembly factor BamB